MGERKECTPLEFRCSNQACIDRSRLCDLVKDCSDGEDEQVECGKSVTKTHTLFALSSLLLN
jgi:Low-density lipoprotein receptor domain class A